MKRALLLALLLAGCSPEGCNSFGRGFGFGPSFSRGPRAAVVPSYEWAPIDIAGAQYYFHAAVLDHWWVEEDGATNVALTRVANDTDLVGRIDDPMWGHVARAPTATTKPTYTANAGDPFLLFNGTDDRMGIHNSAAAFNFIHETGVFSILMRIGIHADGSTETVMDSAVSSTNNRGITILRTSSNFIQVLVLTGGGAGTQLFTCTTTDTLLDADGLVAVEIRGDNANGIDIRIAGGTLRSCARTTAPAAGNAFGDLTLGARTGGVTFGELEIQDVLITNTYVSDADATLWRNYAPTVSTYLRQTGLATCEGWPWFNFHHRSFDFTDTTTLWQDTARTTAADGADVPIRVVDFKRDSLGGDLNRAATAATDAERPLYQADGTGALFDGTDDDLPFDVADDMRAGARTWAVIARAGVADPTANHHVWQAGSGYMVFTGDQSASNTGGPCSPGAYMTIHPITTDVAAVCLGSSAGFNLAGWRRDGSAWNSRTRGGGIQYTASGVLADGHGINGLGEDAANVEMDGNIVRFESWQAELSDTQLDIVQAGLIDCHPGLSL